MREMLSKWFLCIYILIFVCSSDSLEEGSYCNIHDGTSGICTVDRSCKWALEKLKSKELKANQLVRCGLKGSSSIICCKDETLVAASTLKPSSRHQVDGFIFENDSDSFTPPMPMPLSRAPTRKSEQACELIKTLKVKDLDFHILNGEGTLVGEFPHMAAIGFSDEVNENIFTYDCGGSLISSSFVLTAGHCVNNRNRQPKTIKLGRVSLIDNPDDPNEAQDIPIKKVHLHPSYSSRKKYNDIALLELVHEAEYKKVVRPACLYSKSAAFGKSEILEITGWGRVSAETHEKANWLLKAAVNEVPLNECKESYKDLNLSQLPDNLVQTQLCATKNKDGNIIDACQGDSGGPIQFRTKMNGEDVFHVVGVTSFGASCGSDIPGIYTRVAEYLDWIEQIVWPAKVSI